MSKLTFSISALFLLFLQWGYAQQPPLREFLERADTAYAKGNHKAAFLFYESVLDYPPKGEDSLRVLYNYAESARKFNAFEPAERAYQEAYNRMQLKKNTATKQYEDVLYYLAEVEQRQGKYEEAAAHYTQFITANPSANVDLLALAERGAQNAKQAQTASASPLPVQITRLKGSINAPNADFGMATRGDTLYYSTLRNVYKKDTYKPAREYAQIYTSVNGEEGKPLSEQINEPGEHVSNTAFNRDGSKMYYTVCQYKPEDVIAVRCDIYVRQRLSAGKWGPAKKLAVNTSSAAYTTTQPAIGYDAQSKKEILYFISDRPAESADDSLDLNIWFGTINPDRDVTSATPLTALNTSEDEATPFFFEPTQTLYFSSQGHNPHLGGYDIYEASQNGTNWSTPTLVRDTISTSYDDLYFTLTPRPDSSLRAYFASNKPGTYVDERMKACCSDIFTTDLRVNLMIHVFNRQDGTPINGATVALYDQTTGKPIGLDTMMNASGNTFTFPMTYGKKYLSRAAKTGLGTGEVTTDDALKVIYANNYTVHDTIYLSLPMDLEIYTFRAIDRTPLAQVNVDLYKINATRDTVKVATKSTAAGNVAVFQNVERGSQYLVKGINGAYFPESKVVDLSASRWRTATLARDSLYFRQEVVVRIVDCNTKLPLTGGTLEIIYPNGNKRDSTNAAGSDFLYAVDLYKSYPIVASRPGYESRGDTLDFPPNVVATSNGRLTATIQLCPTNEEIELFFDNAIPARVSSPLLAYKSTYTAYERLEDIFIQRAIAEVRTFKKRTSGTESNVTGRLESFFGDMRSEFNRFNTLMEQLNKAAPNLVQGDSIVLRLVGEASPRGNPVYNQQLSERRIRAVNNEIKKYIPDAIAAYVDAKNPRPVGNKPIRIYTRSNGESKAYIRPPDMSDEEWDSIGAAHACDARKVRVVITYYGSSKQKIL